LVDRALGFEWSFADFPNHKPSSHFPKTLARRIARKRLDNCSKTTGWAKQQIFKYGFHVVGDIAPGCRNEYHKTDFVKQNWQWTHQRVSSVARRMGHVTTNDDPNQ